MNQRPCGGPPRPRTKAALALLGRGTAELRLPLVPATAAVVDKVAHELRHLGLM